MSSAKSIVIHGMACLVEASYNAGGSPATSTDGVQLAELPQLVIGYANDGARSMPPGTTGYQRKVGASGRTGARRSRLSPRVPAPRIRRASRRTSQAAARGGLRRGGDTTGGSEKWVYTFSPGPVGYASLVANLYARGELYPLQGIYSDFLIGADGPVVPLAEFAVQGCSVRSAIASRRRAIAYPLSTIDPPKAANITFSYGNYAANAIVRKWQIKARPRDRAALNQNAGGHAGFSIGRRTPQLEVTYETPVLVGSPFHSSSGIDPYHLFDLATTLAVALTVGAVQYNKYKISSASAQIMSPPTLDADGPTALTTLTLQLNPSAQNLNDDVTILFN
jgi:hypothetical protein